MKNFPFRLERAAVIFFITAAGLESIGAAEAISGRVVANGVPISGVRLAVFYTDDAGSENTYTRDSGLNGQFDFSRLDAPNRLYLMGSFQRPDWSITHIPPKLSIQLNAGESRDIGDVEVMTAPRTVSGRASAYHRVQCTATIGGNEYFVWTYTGDDGVFRFRLPDGTWKISSFVFGDELSAEQTVVVDGGDIAGLEIGDAPPTAVFQAWAESNNLFGLDAAFDADPDLDGFANGTEFAFGTDPSTPTPSLTDSARQNGQLTVSWLEREDGFFDYFVRGSGNLRAWEPAAVDVAETTGGEAPAGYTRKEFTVSASGKGFFRVLATDDPAAVPDQSFTINVAGEPVSVERWGTGPKALVFFGYIPFSMQEDLKNAYAGEFAQLVGAEYSMFLWTYPGSAAPFSDAIERYIDYNQNETSAWAADKIDFSGVTTSVVSQIRAATGLAEVCVVANSFGAGVVLWDFAALSADPDVRFVLISPTELYMPMPAGLPPENPLPRTLLAADPGRDPFFNTPAARQYLTERANAALPPGYDPALPWQSGHFVIGQPPTSLAYVFTLIDSVYQKP